MLYGTYLDGEVLKLSLIMLIFTKRLNPSVLTRFFEEAASNHAPQHLAPDTTP